MDFNNYVILEKNLITGIPLVDEQHQKLINLAHDMKILAYKPDSEQAAMEALEFLGAYAMEHFAYEESIQKEVGFQGYEAHKKKHADFVAEFLKLKIKVKNEGITPEVIKELSTYILSWVINHIGIEDLQVGLRYKEFHNL